MNISYSQAEDTPGYAYPVREVETAQVIELVGRRDVGRLFFMPIGCAQPEAIEVQVM